MFEAGSLAFDNARYDDAVEYFPRAYEPSGRAVLLHNVGVAADRLRRDTEALEAFEQFLAQVPAHPRRRDVEARVEVLRLAAASAGSGGEGETGEGETAAGHARPRRPTSSPTTTSGRAVVRGARRSRAASPPSATPSPRSIASARSAARAVARARRTRRRPRTTT